jgi:hypothetical protein
MGEPEIAVIFPERDLATTWADVLDDMRIMNTAMAVLSKKTISPFISKRETMD